MDKICIVLPVHNRKETTLNFLRQLSTIKNQEFESSVVIIDDGSTDGTSEAISKNFPESIIIKGNGQLWWAGAINKGFKFALSNNFDYVYTVNDDIIIFPKTLIVLYNALKVNKNAVCSSVRKFPGYLIAGFNVNTCIFKIKENIVLFSDKKTDNTVCEVDCISTKSTLIPISIIKKLGYFDENHLPHNYSDFDYFLRLKKAGVSLLVDFNSHIVTDASDSNFHRLIVNNKTITVIKTFFDLKYGNHLKTLYLLNLKHNRYFIHYVSFLLTITPFIFWLILRLTLPKTVLIKILKYTGRLS